MSTVKKLLLTTNIDPAKSASGDVGALIPLIPNNAGRSKPYSITAADLWKLGNVVYDSAHQDFTYSGSYGSDIHTLSDWLDSVNEKYIKQFEWNFSTNPTGYAGFYFSAASDSSAGTTALNFDFYSSVAGNIEFSADDNAAVTHSCIKTVVVGWQAISIPWIGAVGTGFSQTTFTHPATGFAVDPASTLDVGMCRIDTVRYDQIVTMAVGNLELAGTAQASATSSLTLAAGASEVADAYADMVLIIQGGTGAGQVRNVVASRKNLARNSESLDSTYWAAAKSAYVTITPNDDGNAEKFTVGTWPGGVAQTVCGAGTIPLLPTNDVVFVVEVKRGSGTHVGSCLFPAGSTTRPRLNLTTGAVAVEYAGDASSLLAVVANAAELLSDGYWRWTYTVRNLTGLALPWRPLQIYGTGNNAFSDTTGMYHWARNLHVEEGSSVSGYIRTENSSAVGVIVDAAFDPIPDSTSTLGLYSAPTVLNGVQFALEKIDPGSKQYNVRLDRIKINQVVVDGPAADPDRYMGIPRWTYKWAGNGFGAWRGPSAVGYNWLAGWAESGIVNPDNNAVLSDAMLQMMYDSQQAYKTQFPAKQIGPFVPRYGRASWEALNQGGYVAGVWTTSTYNKWYWPDTDDWYGYTMRALLSVAQHYYLTESAQAKTILDNWMAWLDVYIIADGAYWWPPSGYGNDGVPTYTYKPVYSYVCIAAACIHKYWVDGDALALKWYRRMLDDIYARKRQTATGTCIGISRTTEGSGYTSAAVVFTCNGGAVAPTATAVIAGGKVVRYTVDTPGSGITSISAEVTGDGAGATCNPYLSDLLVGAFDANHSGWEIAEIFNTFAMLVNGSKPGGTVHYPIAPVPTWDVSTGAYANKSLSSATQDATTNGIAFSADGTQMYVVGDTNNTIYQYTLATAWDASTGSYSTKSYSVAAEDVLPWGITFSPDGLNMYVSGETGASVYQYALSTAWDVSTASYASKSLLISGQDGKPRGLAFNSDGTILMVAGYTSDSVYQYTLATGWDLSTGAYATKSVWIGGESFVTGLAFKPDGTVMYTCGTNNSRLYQYALSAAWDLSTASYANKSLLVSAQDTTPTGLAIKADGSYIYVAGQTNDATYQYALTTSASNDLAAFTGLIELYQRNTTNTRPSLLNADMIPIHEWDIDPYHNGSGIENPMIKDTHARGAMWTETLAPTLYAAVEYGRYSGNWTWLGKLYDLTLEFIGLPGGSTHLADTPRPSNGLMDAYTDIIGGEPLQANKRGNLDGATYVVNASKQIIIPATAGGGNVTWVRGAWVTGVIFRYEGFMADIDPDYVGDTTNYATVSATNQYVGGVYSTVIQLAASATIGATLQVYYSYRDGTLSLKGEAMSGWPMLHRDQYQGTANDGDNYMMVALYHAWRSTGDAKYKTAADRIGYALLEAGRWEGNEATFSLPIEEESGQVGFYTYFADNTPFSATIENNPGLRIRSLVLTGQTPANYAGFGLWPSWSIDAATPFTSIDFDLFDFGDAIPPSGSISYTVTIDGTPAAPPANGILSAGDIQVINLSGYAVLTPSHEDIRSMSKSVSGVVEVLHYLSIQSFQLEVRNVAEDRAGVNYYAILNALNDEISLGTVLTWSPDFENYPTAYYLCVGKKRLDPQRIDTKPLWIFKFDLITLPSVQTPSTVPAFVAA